MSHRKEKVKCPCCDGYGWIEVLDNVDVEETIKQKVKVDILNEKIRIAKEEG